jgi:hypothetical protein
MGPEPTILSRKEVDALYATFEAVVAALEQLKVDYIVTGGSLLGAIRQHSILILPLLAMALTTRYPRICMAIRGGIAIRDCTLGRRISCAGQENASFWISLPLLA